MNATRRKRTWLGELTRRVLAVAAALVIVLALAIGGFRLLIAQLPGYQAQLQAWVTETLGLDVDFARVDVRLGLRGPELTFHDASIGGAGQGDPFLSARQARVRIDARALLTEHRVRFSQLVFDGTRLVLVRDVDGELSLQGAPLPGRAGGAWDLELPAELEVAVHDSTVVYLDRERAITWEFHDLSGSLTHANDVLTLTAQAAPPAQLAGWFEFSLQAQAPSMRVDGPVMLQSQVRGLSLAELARALPDLADLPQQGNGDVAVEVHWHGSGFDQVNATIALVDVQLADVQSLERSDADASPRYEQIRFAARWRSTAAGWQIAVDDVALVRSGRAWPRDARTELAVSGHEGSLDDIRLTATFARIDDLLPMLPQRFAPEVLRDWITAAPRGDLRDLDVSWTNVGGDSSDYRISARFERLDIPGFAQWPEVRQLSGELRADARSGRLQLDSRNVVVDWPTLFRQPLAIDTVSGLLVWREGRDGVRVVSDNLELVNAHANTLSNLELTWPLDGSSPILELVTTLTDSTVPAVRHYLPEAIMAPGLVTWLDHALVDGRVVAADITFFGPLQAFPFDDDEGRFHAVAQIEDGVLAYLEDWPVAEGLDGTVEFVNASFDARGRGQVLGHAGDEIRVRIPDMRRAVIDVDATADGPLPDVLRFLRSAPLIARQLGPEFDRVVVLDGDSRVALQLSLPLADPSSYELQGSVAMLGGDLAISGVAAHATDIEGVLAFSNDAVFGDGISAMLLDGPVTARVESVSLPGYRARVSVEGDVDVANVLSQFELPGEGFIAGRAHWQGSLLLPVHAGNGGAPVRASVSSNLSGVGLQLPAPFAKGPADAAGIRLDIVFPDQDRMELRGDFGFNRRFALAWRDDGDGLALDRGTLRFGGAWPELPQRSGFVLDGQLGEVRLDDWLALARDEGLSVAHGEQLLGMNLDFVELHAFGQSLGSATVSLARRDDAWQLDIDSDPVAGQVTLTRTADARADVHADMQRLHLNVDGGADLIGTDPRTLPGLSLTAGEFMLGARHFGRVEVEVVSEPLGLRMTRFRGDARSFAVDGSGSWFLGSQGAGTQLSFALHSSDVAASLDELGFERFAEGQSGDVSASIYWPGPPSGDWARHVNGELSISVNTGSLVDVQPGAGRLVGLMSITALPRRLALDFRDVFQRGLVFDQISGDFQIDDGNAYTSNLTLTGPAVEIGVAGRTGLRDHDYQQTATVTAEPGKVLPTVGGLIGGPGVGAALLLFTHIFREPLKGIGRVNYCVTGSWEDPQVERLPAAQSAQTTACVAPVPEVRLSSAAAETGMQ